MSWMSVTLKFGECYYCTFHLSLSCSRRSAKEFFMKNVFKICFLLPSTGPQKLAGVSSERKKVETITWCEMSTHKHRKPWRRFAAMVRFWSQLGNILRRVSVAFLRRKSLRQRVEILVQRWRNENEMPITFFIISPPYRTGDAKTKKFIKFFLRTNDDDPATPEMNIKS